jgi:hypothetical protein
MMLENFFENLRQMAIIECTCKNPHNKHLIAPIFHNGCDGSACGFREISEEGFRQIAGRSDTGA